jgi:accessory gene regulator B
MKENFVNGSIKLITKYNDYPKEKIEWINYGLQALYTTITKFTVILTICIILGIYKELLLIILFYSFLRLFGSGFHGNSNIQCWMLSTPLFISFSYLSKNIIIPLNIKLAIMIFSIIMFAFFAPADTKKKPMIRKNIRIRNKILTIFTGIVYLYLAITIKNNTLSNTMIFSSILQVTVILPLTYYLFKQPYNNYKTYKPKT